MLEIRKTGKSIWTKFCQICGNLYKKFSQEIQCEECKKEVGPCCAALYYCQSNWGTCQKCFDYKCFECDKNLISDDQQYVGDTSMYYSCYPICCDCLENI